MLAVVALSCSSAHDVSATDPTTTSPAIPAGTVAAPLSQKAETCYGLLIKAWGDAIQDMHKPTNGQPSANSSAFDPLYRVLGSKDAMAVQDETTAKVRGKIGRIDDADLYLELDAASQEACRRRYP